MSRIGLKPIAVPDGVKVRLDRGSAKFEGPQGSMELAVHSAMKVSLRDGQIVVERPDDQKANKALHGLTRSLLAGAVTGVKEGYERTLDIEGVGFTAKCDGKKLTLQVGFANPVHLPVPAGLKVQAPTNQRIVIRGCDKHLVVQFAANVRRVKPPEPYKGKGIRYTGERIQRKAGKAFVSGEK
jgi:large subunit ribosomal protein L6